MIATIETADSVEAIQHDYPGWHIWRGLTRTMEPSDTCWCASLRDPRVGVDPTVVARSATELRSALDSERRRAEGGILPLDLLTEDV